MLVLISAAAAGSLLLPDPSTLRVICSDVDGTLLTPSHVTTERTTAAVLRSMDRAEHFCCATGRGRSGAYMALGRVGDQLRARGAPGVFLNGLIAYGPGGEEILSEQTVPAEVVRSVAAFAAEHGAAMVGYQRDRIICDVPSEWTAIFPGINEPMPEALGPWDRISSNEPINKLIVLAEPERHTGELRPALTEHLGDAASLTMAVPTMLEVLPKGGSKGAGVQVLLERLGVDPQAVMALGDAENDLGMLELAGLAVAMGNAPPSVQAVAQYVTASNKEGDDGAARALERLFLGDARGDEAS